jgi:hypothetical protein
VGALHLKANKQEVMLNGAAELAVQTETLQELVVVLFMAGLAVVVVAL